MPAPKHPDAQHSDAKDTLEGNHSPTDHRTNDIVRRLKSVEGHVRGVQRMVEDGEYCIDVVNQIIGIQRALKKVSALLLDHHLHACVTDAMRGPDAAHRERVLGELLDVFDASGRA